VAVAENAVTRTESPFPDVISRHLLRSSKLHRFPIRRIGPGQHNLHDVANGCRKFQIAIEMFLASPPPRVSSKSPQSGLPELTPPNRLISINPPQSSEAVCKIVCRLSVSMIYAVALCKN
jgi:hypothetical protein